MQLCPYMFPVFFWPVPFAVHEPLSPRGRGFTLLELLLVLALAGLMITLVPPLFSSALAGTEVRTYTRQIAAALTQARSSAIAGQHETVLLLDLQARELRQQYGLTYKQLPDSIDITLITADTERISEHIGGIRFFSDGSSTGGRFELTGGGYYFVIDVDWLTGRISIGS